jgi:predicted amidohydrolase YtcJ
MAVETSGDRIVRVAPAEQINPRADALIFPDSALLIPGFHDAHLHLLSGGLRMRQASFADVKSKEEFKSVLDDYAKSHSGGWIQGWDLDETRIQITWADIEQVCADKPVFIWSHDWHSAVVNATALKTARVDETINDPSGGRFERDESGKLSGVLREEAAHVVQRAIPLPTSEAAHEALLRAQKLAFSYGITAASASVRDEDLLHYFDFLQNSDCKIRMNAWRVSRNFDLNEDRFVMQTNPRFRFATIKGFVDGALGSRTAAFAEPYTDDPTNAGLALVREGPLARYVSAAHREGYQLAFHAIGDRANSICLDAFEMASSGGRGPELRPRIEHCQHLRERDIPRFAELGVIASMQPIHCTADMRFVEPRLGSDRAKRSYAWRSLLNAGAILAFGSDWPVETLNPITGIHAAVTRQNAAGEPTAGWQPQERIYVADALLAFTLGSAYAAHWEHNIGTIEVGKLADLAVLSKNILNMDASQILGTEALLTVANGEISYSTPL